jgi:hypothetical protein
MKAVTITGIITIIMIITITVMITITVIMTRMRARIVAQSPGREKSV